MRRVVLLIVYAFLFMMIGRNLSFLPELRNTAKAQIASKISQKVTNYLKTQKGQFSVYYKDLTTEETFGVDENTLITAASLNKLPIVFYLYSQAAAKKTNLDDTVVVQDEDMQDYGTGIIRYEEAGNAYSLKTLAKLTLENSDNTAAHVLSVRMGPDNIEQYVKDNNLLSTSMKDNKTTARDMAFLLEALYHKKIASAPLTKELLGFMKDTQFEDRLARYLKTEEVYHKTGDAVRMVHDVGIITDEKGPFILTVLSRDVESEDQAKKAIGEIAQMVVDTRSN